MSRNCLVNHVVSLNYAISYLWPWGWAHSHAYVDIDVHTKVIPRNKTCAWPMSGFTVQPNIVISNQIPT